MKFVDLLRRMFEPASPEVHLPPVRSTRIELREARRQRKDEHDRTEELARLLDDYRRQDHIFHGR
jgi:hypothetical protein